MSLFSSIFGGEAIPNNDNKNQIWTPLTDVNQLKQITDESASIPVLLFKHSTRCSISRMVLSQFERAYNAPEGTLKCYYLDLLNHRDISNEIAEKFNVYHQSPQILIIKNGICIYDASHESIDFNDVITQIK